MLFGHMENENRLSKILAQAGVASRRACEELIFEGRVMVNGKTCFVPQTKVSLDKDAISVDGQPIQSTEKKVYYILNKPHGYTCSSVHAGKKKIVLDLFSIHQERLFTVGRLDRDTTGLLLVTNDGHFCNKVIHPSANLVKEYLVKTSSEITHDHLKTIAKGIYIEKSFVKPVKVTKVRDGTLKICVKEGKKREVRLMVQAAELPLVELRRIRIGGLNLGTLPEGEWREMTEQDKKAIFS